MLFLQRNVPLPDPQERKALSPPPGTTPNLMNPPSIATSFQVGFGICVGISGLFVVTRTYTRIFLMKKWALDDCMYPSVAEDRNLTSDQI